MAYWDYAGDIIVSSDRIVRGTDSPVRVVDENARIEVQSPALSATPPSFHGEFDSDILSHASARGSLAYSISDATVADAPIIGINRAFCDLTGYEPGEVLGRNCRFLQGPETDRTITLQIRQALDRGEPQAFELVNYRKDGTPFWNRLRIETVRDRMGRPFRYVATQEDVSERYRLDQDRETVMREMNHRIGNLFTVALSVVYGSSREDGDMIAYRDQLIQRLSAVASAHSLIFSTDLQNVPVEGLVASILDPDNDARIQVRGDEDVGVGRSGLNLALVLHELMTNAYKHGALSVQHGRVHVSWERRGDVVLFDWIETQGPSPGPIKRKGFGSSLVKTYVRSSKRADARFDLAPGGLRCAFDFPAG